jgi:hypothetical protein
MNIGKYEIETYYVVINGQTETRQRIIYTANGGEDFFIERYYGSIRDGYKGSNTYFKNLNWSDIKSHIPGETIVINDKSTPPKPQIYLTIASIESIQRDGSNRLIVVDTQIDPVTLEFLTPFDYDQAYSILNYVLQNPYTDIDLLVADQIPPIIFFNEYFFAEVINLQGAAPGSQGPYSTDDGLNFLVSIDLSTFAGPKPITKNDLIQGLIYDVSDNRDGSIGVVEDEILIYKDVINPVNLVDQINSGGNYIIKINIKDLGQNQNNATIVLSVV